MKESTKKENKINSNFKTGRKDLPGQHQYWRHRRAKRSCENFKEMPFWKVVSHCTIL